MNKPNPETEFPPLDPSRRDVLCMGLAGFAAMAAQPLHKWLPAWQAGTSDSVLKRIYLAPDDHTDLFWTANDASYREAFVRMIDYYLDLADSTADLPFDFQSRWNCDGSYWVWTYERAKPDADFQRLIGRIRDGHLSMPLNALVINNGGAPAEAILRGMYYAGKLERRHELRFPIAISMENQTLPLGLASLWAGAGARYSWKGICGCDTLVQAAIREREVYWAEGLDGSRVLLKWNSRIVDNKGIGGYAEARDPAGIVEFVDTDGGFLARYPYQVVGAFGKGWDDFETMTDEFVQVAQEKTNGQRLVIVSNQKDFFEDFEASYGGDIPSAALSFGNDWDLYCAALAEVSAQIKRAVEALRGAEALASVAVWLDPLFMDGREAARDQAWMDLGLFWEHNFGVAGRDDFTDERIAWQRQLADEVTAYVTMLRRDALALITSRIAVPYGEHRFIAFNPLGRARTDIVDVPFDQAEPAHVIDVTTGDEVPSQIVVNEGRTYLRVLASEVPAVGYKTFEVRRGAGERGAAAIGSSDGTLETSRYRVTVSGSGAIISLIDKAAGDRELIQLIGGRAANDLGGSDGVVVVENAGPVSATLLAQGDGPLAHRTRIVLIEGVDRIEIVNEITENFNDVHTWAFSFNLPDASLWHEEVGALLRVKLEQEGGHYSAQNARYDWLTLNHFADLSGADGYGATLSNADCYFMKFGGSTPEHLDISSPQINVLAGGRVGGDGRFGIPDQGGDRYFLQRFALRGRAEYSPASAMRFALEHQNPLIARMLPGASTSEAPVGTMPEDQFSLLHLDSDEVLLWALKPSDDQPGALVVRAWNLADSAQPSALATALAMPDRITPLTHIETPSGDVVAFADGAEQLMLAAKQVRTFAITFA